MPTIVIRLRSMRLRSRGRTRSGQQANQAPVGPWDASAARLPASADPPSRSITTLTPLPIVWLATTSANPPLECVDAMIQPERLEPLELVRGARRAPNQRPHGVGDLNGGRADTAAGGMHQHALAGCQAALGQQSIMRRDKRLGDRRGLHEVEVGRDRHRHPLVSQDVLGLSPAGHDPEDAVAWFERADDVRSQRIDLAGIFEPGNIGRCAGGSGIIAPALQQVGPVQAAGPHPHAHLVAPWFGCRYLADLQNFRAAGPGDHDGFHGNGLAILSERDRVDSTDHT